MIIKPATPTFLAERWMSFRFKSTAWSCSKDLYFFVCVCQSVKDPAGVGCGPAERCYSAAEASGLEVWVLWISVCAAFNNKHRLHWRRVQRGPSWRRELIAHVQVRWPNTTRPRRCGNSPPRTAAHSLTNISLEENVVIMPATKQIKQLGLWCHFMPALQADVELFGEFLLI